jgi:V/A-type H+-transporting ATPase subunit B
MNKQNFDIEYSGLDFAGGPIVVLSGVYSPHFEEIVEITCGENDKRIGRIIAIDGDKAVIQVFQGTDGISLANTRTKLTGDTMKLSLSKDILGRVFDGGGRVADGFGPIWGGDKRDINGLPINPVSRAYPQDWIATGISSIDGMATLIKGQKLPIFSGSGMGHNELAAQIVRQTSVKNENYGIIFAAMGVKNDIAQYFLRSFEENGVIERVAVFLNLANDPIIERILTPRCALTAAEYLAFEHDMDILVIMTDMTSYAEALREFSSAKGEIPGRKGFPGYLYSDLASLYERAGKIKGKAGSVTQIPILTMPNDDINHPVPDLTGYITEGQIVLDRTLEQRGIIPAISPLMSLSRLMKDGIGKDFTREDHSAVINQLYSAYAKVIDVRSLASVIGEEDLSPTDKLYIAFGAEFEGKFLNQGENNNRTIDQTLDMAWKLLFILPDEELDRLNADMITEYKKKYKEESSNAGISN